MFVDASASFGVANRRDAGHAAAGVLKSGMPHAYHGMYDVVTVGDGGTPTA